MTPIALRAKLALVYAAVLAVLLAGFGAAAYHLFADQLDDAADAEVQELTDGLHGYLRFDSGLPTIAYDRTDPSQTAFITTATRYYQIYDADTGAIIVQSDGFEPLALHFTPAEVAFYRTQTSARDIRTDQGRLRFTNTVLRGPGGRNYLLQVGILLADDDAKLDRLRRLMLWSIPVVVAIVALFSRWLAGRSLSPLGALATAARGISVSELHQRLPVRGAGDEVDQVATAFNDTLARLESSVGEMRQFSAALAHELRTPLAALRGEIETTLLRARTAEEYQRSLGSQLEELDRLGRLVTHLLTLARAEAGQIRLARAPVDLSQLGASLVSQLDAVADAKGVALLCDAPSPVVVTGDAGWLERLELNLLDNAIKFTPSGGRVTLHVHASGDTATLSVSDTGIGIPANDLPHVFERFYRADSARSPQMGVGLGLTLAKWIADHHGATIEAASVEGHGSTLTVSFPVTSTA